MRERFYFRPFLGAVSALSLVIAACGSSDNEPSAESEPVYEVVSTEQPTNDNVVVSTEQPTTDQPEPQTELPEPSMFRGGFHVVDLVGWEYDVNVSVDTNQLALEKDISTSPPGRARLVATMPEIQVEDVGTLEGRTAPGFVLSGAPNVVWELDGVPSSLESEPIGALGGAFHCEVRQSESGTAYLACDAPWSGSGYSQGTTVITQEVSETALDDILASLSVAEPTFVAVASDSYGNLGPERCRASVYGDGSIDEMGWPPGDWARDNDCLITALGPQSDQAGQQDTLGPGPVWNSAKLQEATSISYASDNLIWTCEGVDVRPDLVAGGADGNIEADYFIFPNAGSAADFYTQTVELFEGLGDGEVECAWDKAEDIEARFSFTGPSSVDEVGGSPVVSATRVIYALDDGEVTRSDTFTKGMWVCDNLVIWSTDLNANSICG